MTKYKLLKDLPGMKEGTIINESEDKKTIFIETDLIWTNQELGFMLPIFQNYSNHKEWFEEIKEVKSIYDLEKFDTFYTINANYDIDWRVIENWCLIGERIVMWNAFLTKEEAETELQKRKAMATIKKWSHDNDWGSEYIHQDCYEIGVMWWDLTVIWPLAVKTINNQYYSCLEIAEQALKELEAEYKILFNIK